MMPFELILVGTGVIQSLLLLLVTPDEDSMKDDVHRLEVDRIMKKYGYEIGERNDIRDFVSFILKDDFKGSYLSTNKHLERKLLDLKDLIFDYLFTHLKDIVDINPDTKVFDVHKQLGNYVIQLKRLRQVIEPEVQFSNSKHTVTGTQYLSVKGFWTDDSGEKIRKFTRSLGKTDDFPNWKEDKKVRNLGVETIRQVLLDEYNGIYQD